MQAPPSPTASSPADSPEAGGSATTRSTPAGNLTQQQKLVRYVPGVDSVPDHHLVVYKKSGAGRELRGCLAPGERLKKSIFESPDSFVSFAVPRDPDLRYGFSQEYKSHDQVHSFKLSLTLEYRVAEPAVLVDRLESDPLLKLEKEVASVLGQANKTVGWMAIEREEIDLQQVLFAPHLDRLRRFAAGQGFHLERILVERELAADEIRDSLATAQAQKERVVVAAQHSVEVVKGTLDQDLRLHLAGQQGNFDRTQKVADGLADSAVRAIHQVTDGITTFQGVHEAVAHARALQAGLLGAPGGTAVTAPLLTAPGLAAAAPAGALPAMTVSSSARNPLAVLLEETCAALGNTACEPARRRQLLSLALHVVAEALHGEDAQRETLDRYAEGLQSLFHDLFDKLSDGQIQLLHRLLDTASLCRELSGGASHER